ncbi:hypothetical protein OJ997_07110 [Solirubrobacter phytolaccae]|uniref:Uncharacterized protein n=1 Tax=Solirubrobacter phytolaccae TaxID=1404360 RepID=A0A9X3N5L4_9ACTN|nr:hypothetical protein [Solirubrobacter phytolaccae]MDA0180059.1 hypothetical protein [Solirubrobacter phytolaccae]
MTVAVVVTGTDLPNVGDEGALIDAFDFAGDPPRVIIDAIERHYAKHGTAVEITGLSRESETLHASLSGQLAGAH